MSDVQQDCSDLESQNREYLLELDSMRNELFELQRQLEGSGKACKLIKIPYGTDEPIQVVFEGGCGEIRNYIAEYEQDPEQSKRCSFMVIAGSILPADKWAPIDSPFVYEPSEKKIG